MVLLYKRLNQKLSPELIIAKVKPRTYNCVNFLLDKGYEVQYLSNPGFPGLRPLKYPGIVSSVAT